MQLSQRIRKRLAIVLLIVWLPVYVVLVAGIIGRLDRLPFVLELAMYCFLGVAWALPLKAVFRGVGKAQTKSKSKH